MRLATSYRFAEELLSKNSTDEEKKKLKIIGFVNISCPVPLIGLIFSKADCCIFSIKNKHLISFKPDGLNYE